MTPKQVALRQGDQRIVGQLQRKTLRLVILNDMEMRLAIIAGLVCECR